MLQSGPYFELCHLTYLPTNISSHSDARLLKLFHRSMVKMVLELLKMEVREDMRAAIITAIISPRRPGRENTQRLALKEMQTGVRE